MAIRQKNEAEEKLSSIKLTRDGQEATLDRANDENAKLKGEIDNLKSDSHKFNLDKKVLNQKVEDLSLKLDKVQKMKEEM